MQPKETYSTILVAMDGSGCSAAGGKFALAVAGAMGSKIVACHVYGAELHSTRFQEMMPGLPAKYQGEESLTHLQSAHDSLILDGLKALSAGYMERFLAEARSAGIDACEVTTEGRNYVRILELALERKAGLIVLGAQGVGADGDDLLGSTVTRVLRNAACDVLIARRPPGEGRVLAGVDGSQNALGALDTATVWARTLNQPLKLAAAYDPFFHVEVFKTMARALSEERQEEVGLAKHEDLHEQFIDEGLDSLYQRFLDQAQKHAKSRCVEAATSLLRGKAYSALLKHAKELGAGLLVVGRHGHHREAVSDIGSNAEAIVRLGVTNVLVTAGVQAARPSSEPAATESAMEWDADALARLERIPSMARGMARRGIEDRVRRHGGARVTLQAFLDVARSLGMSRHGDEEKDQEVKGG